MKVYKEDVGQSVGVAYKMWMQAKKGVRLNEDLFWDNVKADAKKMLEVTSEICGEYENQKDK